MNSPVIVVGCMRSGTSTVARVLHEKMGVCMGSSFEPVSEKSPEGSYEDERVVVANSRFMTGITNIQEWQKELLQACMMIAEKTDTWGFKHPQSFMLTGLYLSMWRDPTIIRCYRTKGATCASIQRVYGNTEEEAIEYYTIVQSVLDNVLQGRKVIRLIFITQKSDGWVEAEIRRQYGY